MKKDKSLPKGFMAVKSIVENYIVWRNGVWKKGKKRVTGKWCYQWSSDTFFIHLDRKDDVTGQTIEIDVKGDEPNFNGWKLVEEKT